MFIDPTHNNSPGRITAYSHENCLPCDLKQIVTSIAQKPITNRDRKVGLKKDIYAVPLTRGYIIHTEDIVLQCDTLTPFFHINGLRSVNDIIKSSECEEFLNSLHYYDLLSFNLNKGQLIVKDVPNRYKKIYASGDYVTFPLVPIHLELDLTNECNFYCIHCSRNAGPVGKNKLTNTLTLDDFKRIIDECIDIGVIKIILMGGEPFYYQHFFELVKYAKERGIRTLGTSTNGWYINDDTAKELSQYFDDIQVSVHGASSSVHDSIVGKKGAWEQARFAIKTLKKYNLKVNVSYTVMRKNVHELNRMPQLVKDWGGDLLRYLCVDNVEGRGSSLKGWKIEEIFKIGEELKSVYERKPVGLELEVGGFPPLNPIKYDACSYGTSAGMNLLSVESDGTIRLYGGPQGNPINIKEKNILDIWHSAEFVELRKQSDCDCSYRAICYGACRAREV